MSLVCISNNTAGIRSCTVKGEHLAACDGWRGARECRGCLPRPAEHGLLCWNCWENVVRVMTAWPEFAATIAGIDRAVQRDTAGVRTSTQSYIPIPATRLSIDECESYLKSYRGNTDEWVSRPDGATDALQFVRVAEVAFRSHPIEEKAHRIHRFRCRQCSQLSLVWNPPAWAGDHVRVKCATEGCGYELDQAAFELVARVEEKVSA